MTAKDSRPLNPRAPDPVHKIKVGAAEANRSDLVDRLRKHTVLFVGLSMSDPSLRRLLDASRNSKIPPHWQIQKRHQIRDHEVQEVKADVERRARGYAQAIGPSNAARR